MVWALSSQGVALGWYRFPLWGWGSGFPFGAGKHLHPLMRNCDDYPTFQVSTNGAFYISLGQGPRI
jgi:hypothetical protein